PRTHRRDARRKRALCTPAPRAVERARGLRLRMAPRRALLRHRGGRHVRRLSRRRELRSGFRGCRARASRLASGRERARRGGVSRAGATRGAARVSGAELQAPILCAAFWMALLAYCRRERDPALRRRACAGLVMGAMAAHAGWWLLHLAQLAS